MEDIIINKLSEFMEYVEKLPREFTLSRGQENANYSLLPGALRMDSDQNSKYTRQSIAYFLNEFKVNSHHYMETPWDIQNDYEWMVYAQHYGIPTRLLDFTNSHIISLMFVVENAFEEEECFDGAIWFLVPENLNNKNCNRSQVITLCEKQDFSLDDCNGPVVVQGRKLNERINAQNGVFVYFQDRSDPLDESITDCNILRKIVVNGEAKKDILVSLYSMGLGITKIYPELTSVAKDILTKDNISRYLKECE